MTPSAILIKESFGRVEHVAGRVAEIFYARLFTDCPELRELFPLMMDVQRTRLLRALVRIVQELDSPVQLDQFLGQLGADHRKYGVRPAHYEAVGRALVAAVRQHTEPGQWTPEIEAAWLAGYALVAERMIDGAARAAPAPPWWQARVSRVERVSPDIAVLTLRPDQPYPYRPGQFLTLETPRRPRLWRPFSIANAPRPNGALDLHVRAVPGGWVSRALVWHTRVGEELRLGPPQGELRIDPDGPDALLVAGGTGLAPFLALLEAAAAPGGAHPARVYLFAGARRPAELYRLRALRRLAERNPWLTVVGAVSDDPGYPGRRGRIGDVAAGHRNWAGHQILVSGSPAMIGATAAALHARGVPPAEIRYDPYDLADQPAG
jgi:NAD(P)H-flavin reductase/hemoglobin-like flavoprotein